MRRNRTEFRLAHKPTKRDLEWSDANLLELDERYSLSSHGRFDDREDWLRLDNIELPAPNVADLIIEHFGLTTSAR